LWEGVVDNLELAGRENWNQQPARVVEDDDGRLRTEFAESSEEGEYGPIRYDTNTWIADYQMRFRDMRPQISAYLKGRLLAAKLLDEREP
jgi:hypothetical protein